ncbi:hypothetical protein CK203_077423 [Vitis vinifera]|uniref:DUF4283 domain-containing protein n=1 Tax=Vitis vinifera TaxID=29760 RepID=A0A438D266_VITVI|nr:hypothetical protein CK203_077423 [Vitis vinifera]
MILRSGGKFWAKSWDLKGNLGWLVEQEESLLEFEDLEEARRVVSSGAARGKEPSAGMKSDHHNREVRGEEDSRAGQRVMKDWGSGRLEMLHPSDDGRWCREERVAASDVGPDASPSYGREDVGCYSKGPASPLAQLSNKGLFWSKACTQQLDPSYSPEAEFFVARETEDTRKLQGVEMGNGNSHLNSFIFDRTLGGGFFDHSGDLDEEGRADNSMWLTVYKACNEWIKECKELGSSTATVTKVGRWEEVGDIDDAQVERSELEGNWEESGLARFSKFLGFPTEDWRRKY